MFDLSGLITFVKGLGYLGAILSGFLGSSSLFIAIFPSYLIVPILATQLNPFVVGVLAGIGAGVGQYLHYYVGLGGRAVIPKKYKERIEKWRDKWKTKLEKYGPMLIFLFAMTPLTPDDILWISLGVLKYPKLKALVAAVAGKILLNLAYAYAGYYGFKIFVGF